MSDTWLVVHLTITTPIVALILTYASGDVEYRWRNRKNRKISRGS